MIGLGLGLTLSAARAQIFDLASLFAGGEQGAWLDPSDLTTMFQDTAGTTPVTAPAQTVGLVLDKSGNGFHATQPTAANRPTYGVVPSRGRVNLLTYTEQFDNAAWVKVGNATITANQDTAPNGTLTADLYNNGASLSATALSAASNTVSANTNYTFSLYAKRVSGAGWLAVVFRDTDVSNQFLTWFDLSSGVVGSLGSASGRTTRETQSIQAVGDYYRISVSGRTSGTTLTPLLFLTTANGGTTRETNAQAYLWGAQLETGSTATDYQRVVSQFDVTDPAGFPSYPLHYLYFGGELDPRWLQTSTITPNADKVQVFAGVRKLSDAASVIAEFSANYVNSGSFGLFCEGSPGSAKNYEFGSKGTILSRIIASPFAAPITNILAGLGNISGDSAILRVNGTQAASSTADQGTGNYLAYPLFIGRRGGTTLPFNGNLYGLIVRFSTANLDASVISQTERWMAQKTGVTI